MPRGGARCKVNDEDGNGGHSPRSDQRMWDEWVSSEESQNDDGCGDNVTPSLSLSIGYETGVPDCFNFAYNYIDELDHCAPALVVLSYTK